MIKSFKHRGLKRLYEKDDRSGIRPDLLDTVENILSVLDVATAPKALDIPGSACTTSKATEKHFGP